MKALVLKNGKYQWVKVDLTRSSLQYDDFYDTEGYSYYGSNVVAFKGDIRKNKEFYWCGSCKTLVEKSKWDEHVETTKAKAKCFKCSQIRRDEKESSWSSSFKINDDGSVTQKKSITFIPTCYNSRYYPDSSCEATKKYNRCKYYRCNSYKQEVPKSALVKYPKLNYGYKVTIKALIENGWTTTPGNTSVFKYKSKNLYAHINEFGFVTKFRYDGRGGSFEFVYSQYYDKFFKFESTYYENVDYSHYTTSNIWDNVQKIIRTLYTKAN